MSFWSLLGLAPTTDKTAIRHAYAEKTKTCHPEEDPEGFDALHKAFDSAMQYARRNAGRAAAPLQAAPQASRPAQTASSEEPPQPGGRAAAARRARQAARAAEQEALEEYQRSQKRGRVAEPALGQGEQEGGQQFDFSAAQGGERPEGPPGRAASPAQEAQPQRPLTPEQEAWRNQPPPLGEALPAPGDAPRPHPPAPSPDAQGPAGPDPGAGKQPKAALRGKWAYGGLLILGAAALLLARSTPAVLAVLAAACLLAGWLYKKR